MLKIQKIIENILDTTNETLSFQERINNSQFAEIFQFLNIKQKDDFILIKYKDSETLFYNKDLSYHDFWYLYDGVFRECRGFVYNIKKREPVAIPFPKFFNIDEQEETSMDNIKLKLKSAKIIEFSNKLDGTLIISRWYENQPFACTSGSLNEKNYTIQYANSKLKEKNYLKLLSSFPDWTIMFECITANNPLVVVYTAKDYGLHLIGMRNIKTGKLKSYSEVKEIAEQFQIPVTENYIMNFEEILNSRKKFKYTEKEGYVMYLDGILIKIKCDDYILLHKMMKKNISKNSIIKAVANKKIDDMIAANDKKIQTVIYETLDVINEYCAKMDAKVKEIFTLAPKNKVEFYQFVNNQPSMYRKGLKSMYQNKLPSYLIERESGESSSYIKYAELEKRLKELEH